jgi:two-component sensor histidine kinase/integral membrane sensor domain MASE1
MRHANVGCDVPQNLQAELERRLFAGANQTQLRAGSIALAVAVGLAYFAAAQLSLALLTKPDGVAVFWPAAGVAVGVLIAIGPRSRLPVAVGTMAATIVANLLGDRNLTGAIAFALCNAGEALLVAWLIDRYAGLGFSLGKLRNVLALLAAAIGASGISGIGGALGFRLFHGSTAPLLTTWQHWFASDAIGIVTVAPLLIELAAAMRKPPPPNEFIEGVVALVTLAAMSGVVIFLRHDLWVTGLPIALLFPLLLWIAARCRPVFATAAAFIVTVTIVWMTTFGIGFFGDPDLPIADRILAAQAGILMVALCAFVLAALFAERRLHEVALLESEARLQEALTAGAVTAFEWDARTGKSQRSGNTLQILGFDSQIAPTGADFLARVHLDDRARYKSIVRSVRPDRSSYTVVFRFIGPDGREAWLEEAAQADFDAAGHLIRLKGLTVDITERKRAEERQSLLTAELDHRVKNVLARVAVVAMYTRQGSKSMDELVRTLDGRIQSMANAHVLLSKSRWQGVGLADLVSVQLAPYATIANTEISGPDTTLTAAATEAVAMVFHELVTNAAKYGALSTPDGRVLVNWDRRRSDKSATSLIIEWRERGGPQIAASVQTGYGTGLIRDLIPHELGGTVDLVFASDGLQCRIEIPHDPGDGNDHMGDPLTEPPSAAQSLDAK